MQFVIEIKQTTSCHSNQNAGLKHHSSLWENVAVIFFLMNLIQIYIHESVSHLYI